MRPQNARLRAAAERFSVGALAEAERLCRQLLAEDPGVAGGWQLLAQLAERAGRLDDAAELAERSTRLDPGDSRCWTTLGDIREVRREYAAAIAAYSEALARDPRYSPALNNLAAVRKALGDIPGALAAMYAALDASPDHAAIRSNLLTTLLYDDRLRESQLADEHRRLAAWWAEHSPPPRPWPNDCDPDRPLRIGYVSPDLCEHAVMRFFEPLLAAHDRRQFQVFLYSECPMIDAVGQRLRALGDRWCVTWMKSAADVAEQIRREQIDLLVDLAGHTRHNRLDILALRPAPVQVTYLGYPGITGLAAFDARFTDRWLDPETTSEAGNERERLVRLAGGYACFRPPDEAPPVSPSPCESRGYFTFGSHHPLLKLNAGVFHAWREILERLPTARLLLLRSDFVGDARLRLESLLVEHGLPLGQVEIRGVPKNPAGYLASFADVDVVLDAFPFNGHTMTCEALWMGVPVLTHRAGRPAGRLTSSVMGKLGLSEFITETVDDYVARAVELANERGQLSELRDRLRPLVSEQLSAAGWIEHYELACRELWRAWCSRPRVAVEQATSATPAASLTAIRSPMGATPVSALPSAALGARPDQGAAVCVARGEAAERAGRFDEAYAAFTEASRAEPWEAEHALRLGNFLLGRDRVADALQLYRQAVAVGPNCFPAWAMLGQTYGNQGFLDRARESFAHALAIKPDAKAQIVLGTMLPPIYESLGAVETSRLQLQQNLARMREQGVRIDPTAGPVPNFFLLAYLGGNVRPFQEAFASFLVPPPQWRAPRERQRPSGRKIRLGMLSEYFQNHTIGTLNRNLATELDRNRFELTVITGAAADDETAQAYRRAADRHVRLGSDVMHALRNIAELDLDILFYTDLGMSCFTLALAACRLAPVQCVTWGHPLTTGLPTIDYFLSGELYERPDADADYTEQLVRLPGLQTSYPRPEVPTVRAERSAFPLPHDAHWYGCPQTLFKLHPEFDTIVAGILRGDPSGVLVLVEGRHRHWQELLIERWQCAIPDVIDRIHFLPTMPRPEFLSLCRHCDVLLDPIQFGGGNTTLEGLAMGTPVVTWPTRYLRSRLAAGMYRHLGLDDWISTSAQGYVERAVALAADPDQRHAARQIVAERAGDLFNHGPSLRAFEAFFERIANE